MTLLLFLAVVHGMKGWDDFPGVTDNICYLRQAHLFQRFGVAGFDTDLRRDRDGWMALPSRINGFTCHHFQATTGKTVMQYPPGTGFVLSLFPRGSRTAALYIASTTIVFVLACAAILFVQTLPAICTSCAVGLVTLYFMVNPTRSSDSMAPTMALSCLCGLLTSLMFRIPNPRISLVLAGLLGLLFGFATDVRIPNLLLAAGYLFYYAWAIIRRRRMAEMLRACVFVVCLSIGLLPTFISNYVNVGSPFTSAYVGVDVSMPDFSVEQIAESAFRYAQSNQGIMLAIALALMIGFRQLGGASERTMKTGVVLVANFLANMAFYLTHRVYTPYYAMGIATLTIWTVLFSLQVVENEKLIPAAVGIPAGRLMRRKPPVPVRRRVTIIEVSIIGAGLIIGGIAAYLGLR